MDSGKRIAQLVQEACIREVCAPKPGNVNPNHGFSDVSFEDFLISATAIGPAFENAGQACVGRTILQAVEDSRRRVSSNTNLGIILLMAPLAKACLADTGRLPENTESVRENLDAVLSALTKEDALLVYEAIRKANPGGLGHSAEQDIAETPSVTLLETMALAKDRDSIALEYVTNFGITFGTGLPALKKALSRGATYSDAVVQTFLTILSRVPDTLIARKNGATRSRQVSDYAMEVLRQGGVFAAPGRAQLKEMDRALSDGAHKLNPGTTADLTATSIFLALLDENTFQE